MLRFKEFIKRPHRINIRVTSLETARKWTTEAFESKKKNLERTIPDFDRNYQRLSRIVKGAMDVKRRDMPVIRQDQITDFQKFLEDDGVRTKLVSTVVEKLKPIQNEIWLEKLLFQILEPSANQAMVTIISNDDFIIDGHHRWAEKMLTNPKLTMRTLKADLSIDKLLTVARKWGKDAGNIVRENA